MLPEEEKDAFAQAHDLSEDFTWNFFAEKFMHFPEIDEKPLSVPLPMTGRGFAVFTITSAVTFVISLRII